MYGNILFDRYKTYSDEELKEITVSNGYTKEAEEVAMQILHREQITVLECEDGTITFPECSLEAELFETKLLLQRYLQADEYTPEVCLEQINNRPLNDFLATVKGNLDMINKVVERITRKVPLQKGERIFLFCSRGEFSSVNGFNSLIGNGYLVTSKRVLSWNGEDICVSTMAEIQSLTVDPLCFHWCLNGSKDINLYRRNQNKEELALILSLIFLLAKEENVVSEKTKDMAEQPQMKAQAAKPVLSLTERLREAKALYDEGLITESEYAALREKILDKFV